jgi:hypothetical protein
MNTTSYLPSRRFILVVGTLLSLVLLVGGVVWYTQSKDRDSLDSDPALVIQEIRESATDSDKDGLTDWEEELWGTNLKITDSDGDGTSDGDEVEAKRDPLKPGPDDALSPEQAELVYKIPTTQARANATSRFVDSSLPNALLLANRSLEGEKFTQEDINELIEPYIPPENVSIATYVLSDLTITGNTAPNLQEYSESLKGNINSYKGLVGNELPLIADVLRTGDINKLLALRAIAVRYESFALGLKEIPVPSSLAQTHLEAVNWYAAISGSLLSLSETAADPLRGLIGLREYETASAHAEASLRQLLTTLADKALEAVQ